MKQFKKLHVGIRVRMCKSDEEEYPTSDNHRMYFDNMYDMSNRVSKHSRKKWEITNSSSIGDIRKIPKSVTKRFRTTF